MKTVFLIVAISIAVIIAIAAIVLKIIVMLLLHREKASVALLKAVFFPNFAPFRLKNDGTIDAGLLRLARLHDRVLRYLLYYLGIVMLAIIIVVAFS